MAEDTSDKNKILEETHGVSMNPQVHEYSHFSFRKNVFESSEVVDHFLESEPISILGKNRRISGDSCSSSSVSSRHSVKFSEIDEHFPRMEYNQDNSKNEPETSKSRVKSDVQRVYSCSQITDESTVSSTMASSSCGYSSSFSEYMGGSRHGTPESPKFKNRLTRTQDRNKLIASMELKVPSLLTPTINESGGLSPLAPPGSRGLTILSPHNPPPELHFASTFTVRTRKGKTIVLPKLRIPAFTGPDQFFVG